MLGAEDEKIFFFFLIAAFVIGIGGINLASCQIVN